MDIQEHKDALCEKQYALYTCYIKGLLSRYQYIRLIKPIDIEIDALEMEIFYRYLRRNNIRYIDMKSKIQKEMRKIRVQLKVHNISEEEKKKLRDTLEKLRIEYKKEQ